MVTAEGATVATTRRDSVTPPLAVGRQRRRDVAVATTRAISAPAPVRVVDTPLAEERGRANRAPTVATAQNVAAAARRKRQRSADARAAARDEYVVMRMVAEKASVATPAVGAQAGDRFEALRRRIVAKETAAASCSATGTRP